MTASSILTGKASDFLKIGVGAAGRGDLATLRAVLNERPLWPFRAGSHGRTMLWEASYRGRLQIVEYLFSSYPDIDIEARGCYYTPMLLEVSPLCAAIYKKRKQVAELLRSLEAKYDAVTACYLGDIKSLQEQIELVPSLLHTEFPQHDPQGPATLIHYAVARGYTNIAHWLVESGASTKTPSKRLMRLAIGSGDSEMVRLFLEHGTIVSNQTIARSDISSSEMADLLLAHGAKLDIDGQDLPWPPLVYICRGDRGGNINEIKSLLNNNADVNIRNHRGQSALHCAAKAGFVDAVGLLLEHGAEVDVIDKSGNTPLHAACSSTIKDGQRLQQVINLLLMSGANPDLMNGRGQSARSMTERKKKHQLDITQIDQNPLF